MDYAGWRDVHVGVEGDDLVIDGVTIWAAAWRRTDHDSVELPHPSYWNQRHRFDVYEVGDVQRPVRFAADEVSNGVWAFYVPLA